MTTTNKAAGATRYSVIIPTYNRAQLIRSTLDSVLAAARGRKDVEVVVVDDGSRDSTAQLVTSLATDLEVVYVHQPDRGFRAALARNLGLRLARGSMAVLLDSGVVIQRDFFAAMDRRDPDGRACVVVPVAGFSNDDTNGAELSAAVKAAEDRGDDVAAALRSNNTFADIREAVFRSCDDDLERLPAPWAVAWTCCLVVPRHGSLKGVLFDEAFQGWGGEDLDFALQLHQAGAEFAVDRQTGAAHLPHEKSETTNTASSKGNKAYLHAKHATTATDALRHVSAVDLNRYLSAADTRR
jgi:GT2 family glycosyltransferase